MATRLKVEPFQTAEAIERRLGLRAGFLARRCKSPGGPTFYKLGGRTVSYLQSDVEAWLDCCASDAGEPRQSTEGAEHDER